MNKGEILTSLILLYVLNAPVAGYISARIYMLLDGKNWKMNSTLTATALPGVLIAMFSCLHVFMSHAGAATTVSFSTILVLCLLWICVATPLVFVGAFLGHKTPVMESPTTANQTARTVPEPAWYMNSILTMLLGGILPFASVYIELQLIMAVMWFHQFYYKMKFLLPVLGILAATCTVVGMGSLQLRAEDHRKWWWKSFFSCAMSGVYLFLYSLWYLSSRLLLVGGLSVAVYLTYMSMISICFGVLCGSIGFLSSVWLTRIISRAVQKVH